MRSLRRLGIRSLIIVLALLTVGAVVLTKVSRSAVISQTPRTELNGSSAAASNQGDIYHGVNQNVLQACLSAGGPCIRSVPGLAACMRTYHACNRRARQTMSHGNPLLQPATPGAPLMSEAQAIHEAAGFGPNVAGTGSEMMPYSSVSQVDPTLVGPMATSTREVWVVSVYFKQATVAGDSQLPSGDLPSAIEGYTVVIDAETGVETDYGLSPDLPIGMTDRDAPRRVP